MLPSKFDSFFSTAKKENLYKQLVFQINKDFVRARINIELSESTSPILLKNAIQEKVKKLIEGNYNEFLNLLYIIDVSETKIKQIYSKDVLETSEEITFLILKREWFKVWYRNKH